MYVKPTEGRAVPDPARGDTVPPKGREVEASQYWHRRIADGDVVESEPEPEEETADTAVQTSAQAEPAPTRNKKKES